MHSCCGEGHPQRYHVGDFTHAGTLGHADTPERAAQLAGVSDRCLSVYVLDRWTGEHAWPYHPQIPRPAWWPAEAPTP